MSDRPESRRKYWAFISYSHKDKAWGNWLHHKLETYRVSKSLAGKDSAHGEPVPSRLYPVFRDREELPTSSDLGTQIENALRESRFLIVICSPRAARSLWVNEEILAFKRMGRSDRILAMIVDGEPNTLDQPGREDEECFPEALRFDIESDGRLSNRRMEPIAADMRPSGDGKDNGFLKLAAGLLGVGFDDLRQRDHERRLRRLRTIAVCAGCLVAVFAALGVALFFQRNEAQMQRKQAENQRNIAQAERTRAEEQEALVSRTLAQSDYSLALERLDDGTPDLALAHLARAMRTANHRDAGMRAALLMLQRGWARPASPVLRIEDRGGVAGAVFSPDGRRFALATHEGELEIRDAETMKLVAGPIDLGESTLTWFGEESPPRTEVRDRDAFDYRFTPDGKYLVGSYGHFHMNGDNFVDQYFCLRVWDANTGEPVSEELKGSYYPLEIHPGGEMLVVGGEKASRLFSLPDLRLLHVLEGNSHTFNFSPDGNLLLAIGSGVEIWEARTGTRRQRIEAGDAYARFFDDSQRIALAGDGLVGIVNVATGTGSSGFDPGLDGIRGIIPLPGPSKILVWTEDRVYRCDAAQKLHTEIFQSRSPIESLAPTPDGQRFLLTTDDGAFLVIDGRYSEMPLNRKLTEPVSLSRGRFSMDTLDGLNSGVTAVPSPDGRRALGISAEGTAQLYDLRLSRAGPFPSSRPGLPPVPDNVYDFVGITPDGGRVLASMMDPALFPGAAERAHLGARLLDINTLEPVSGFLTKGESVLDVDFSADGRVIAIADFAPSVSVWDLASETLIVKFDDTSKDSSHVALSPDGKTVAYTSFRFREGGGWTAGITVCDCATGTQIRSIDLGNSTGSIAFSPDGRHLAMASGNDMSGVGFIEVRSIETGELVHSRLGAEVSQSYTDVAYSGDGRFLLASIDEQSEIWSLEIERRVSDSFATPNIGSRGGSQAPAFTADGAKLILADYAYDVAPPGNPPLWFADFVEAVGGVRLAPGGLVEALPDAHAALQGSAGTLAQLPADDGWANLARWFLEEESRRRLSPSSNVTVSEFVREHVRKIRALGPDQSYWADKIRASIRAVDPEWVED